MLAGAVLGAVLAFPIVRLWYPTPPRPPTESELSRLASRFPAFRARLDAMAAMQWDGSRRDDPTRPAEHDIICSDSLMYFAAWARRGYGFSAPWRSAGYVYATRPVGDRSAWPALTTHDPAGIGTPLSGRYEHLDGRWYLYSIQTP